MAFDQRRLVTINVGRGIANRVDETKVPLPNAREGTPGACRSAINTDLFADSDPGRRSGYSLLLSDPGAHSLYTPPHEAFALYASGGDLKRLDPDMTSTVIASGLGGRPLSFAFIAGRVRWSDATIAGEVDGMGEARPWGVATPPQSFVATASANGGLAAGRYQLTLTFVTEAREEGGAPESVFVDVPEGGGIALTGIPVPVEAHVAGVRIYVSPPNGDVLYRAVTVPAGVTAAAIGTHTPGPPLETQFLYPLPAGEFLLAKDGRLFSLVANRLYWSDSLRYGLHRPTDNNLPIPGVGTLLAAPDGVNAPLYVATPTKTYVLAGEINNATQSIAWSRGARKGTMSMVPADALGLEAPGSVPCWLDTDGQFVAGTLGGVVVLNKLAAADTMRRCAATFIDVLGIRKFLVSGRRVRASRMAMGDRAIATIIPAGTVGQ